MGKSKKSKTPALTEHLVVISVKAKFQGVDDAKGFAVSMGKNMGVALQHSEQDNKIDHEFVIKMEVDGKPLGVVIGQPQGLPSLGELAELGELLKKKVMGEPPPQPAPPTDEDPESGDKSFSA